MNNSRLNGKRGERTSSMESTKGGTERHLESGVYTFADNNASCMGVDYSGSYALLAGRRLSVLVNLDDPEGPSKKFASSHKWDPNTLEWNPHGSLGSILALVVNQKVEIRDINRFSGSAMHTLGGHTRVISDMNWQLHDPHLLLTCSMDTYIYVWDIREAKKPSKTFTTVAGSSQVKWNKQNEFAFASAHDGDVRVWDIRKGNLPIAYIAGHLSKIHGIDWSPTKEHCFVTGSNDSTVKFWNFTSPKQAKRIIHAGGPVWRARYAPFGDAVVTMMVPQQLLRGESKLLLWNATDSNAPVHSFIGHTDVILSFEWRSRTVKGYEENQLVTWSKDQTLRLWSVDQRVLMACNGEIFKYEKAYFESQPQQSHSRRESRSGLSTPQSPQSPLEVSSSDHERTGSPLLEDTKEINFDSNNSPLLASPSFPLEDGKLHQEFALLNIHNPIVTFDKIDANERVCIVSVKIGSCNVKLNTSFPRTYPDSVDPVFRFLKETNIDAAARNRLLKSLYEISGSHVQYNRPCFEPCLRQLVQQMEELATKDEFYENLVPQPPPSLPGIMLANIDGTSFGSYQDPAVPYPRYSGARFCGAGKLVVFCKPIHLPIGTPTTSEPSSRSMAALSSFMSNVAVNTTFENEAFGKESRGLKKMRAGVVHVSDISGLLPVHYDLAKNYIFEGANAQEVCMHNAAAAKAVGRRDLVQTWSLVGSILAQNLELNAITAEVPWAHHPFGRRMIKSIFEYYRKIGDVQTLAVLSCVLSRQGTPEPSPARPTTRLGPTTTAGTAYPLRLDRENSLTMKRSADVHQPSPDFPYSVVVASGGHSSSSPPPCLINRKSSYDNSLSYYDFRLLDSSGTRQRDRHKQVYADLLYRWGLYIKRVEVLRYVNEATEPHEGLDLFLRCKNCFNYQQKPKCAKCESVIVHCAVCRLGVKVVCDRNSLPSSCLPAGHDLRPYGSLKNWIHSGLLSFCDACRHGGHTFHYVQWFEKHDCCPAGCGCQCLLNGTISS